MDQTVGNHSIIWTADG